MQKDNRKNILLCNNIFSYVYLYIHTLTHTHISLSGILLCQMFVKYLLAFKCFSCYIKIFVNGEEEILFGNERQIWNEIVVS